MNCVLSSIHVYVPFYIYRFAVSFGVLCTYSYCMCVCVQCTCLPVCFIMLHYHLSLLGCKPEQQMMYAGSKNHLVQAGQFTKVL